MGTRKLSWKLDEILGGGALSNELASHQGCNTPSCLMSWKLSYWLNGLLGLSTDSTSGGAKLTFISTVFSIYHCDHKNGRVLVRPAWPLAQCKI